MVLAIVSILINIGAQALTVFVYSGEFNLWLAIFMGTGAGLVSKFLLDKKYVFAVSEREKGSTEFLLYTSTGVITTAIFWGVEWAFDYYFSTLYMRYVGAVIGLSIGYIIKYQLDKRFVFSGVKAF
jgi:putative flippase GtrA